MLPTLIQRYDKRSFHYLNWVKNEQVPENKLSDATFMIVLILYINLLNLSWLKKYIFLRKMEPIFFLLQIKFIRVHFTTFYMYTLY